MSVSIIDQSDTKRKLRFELIKVKKEQSFKVSVSGKIELLKYDKKTRKNEVVVSDKVEVFSFHL